MAGEWRDIPRLWALYAKMDFRWLTQDPLTAAVVIVSETVNDLAAMSGVLLLAARFGGAGGLTADEVLLMLGFFEMANGLTYLMFGGYNVTHISRRIGRGQADHMLIQPRPLAVQLLTEGFMPFSGGSGFAIGVILTAIACARLRIAVTLPWLGLLLLYIAEHAALKLGQCYLYGAAAFWKPAACEEISTLILDLNDRIGRFPLFGLPKWMTVILTTALPAGLLAYIPALGLLHRIDRGAALALPLCVAAAFLAAAAAVFRMGLDHYRQNSCNRYSNMGHRS